MTRDQQGRGRGHFQGQRGNRSGRGGARRYQGSSPRSGTPTPKPLDFKFTPHVQGKPQVATYGTVKDAIIQFIQKTFKDGNDVAQSLKDAKIIDLNKDEPVREISKQSDADKAAFEQAGYDIKYQEEL